MISYYVYGLLHSKDYSEHFAADLKKSLIKNDANDWAREHHKPRYILDLLLSVINVSVQTVDIVNSLPRLKFD